MFAGRDRHKAFYKFGAPFVKDLAKYRRGAAISRDMMRRFRIELYNPAHNAWRGYRLLRGILDRQIDRAMTTKIRRS